MIGCQGQKAAPRDIRMLCVCTNNEELQAPLGQGRKEKADVLESRPYVSSICQGRPFDAGSGAIFDVAFSARED